MPTQTEAPARIPRKAVKSSQIKSVGYDPAAKRLAIEFNHDERYSQGSVYEYENVDQATADNFFREKDDEGKEWSVGSYFYQTLKKDAKRWPYKKVSSQQ
jgi:hypothetical protein